MDTASKTLASSFRQLHAPGRLLVLPNAWDAGSARLVESCGAEAVATTSAGLSWSHGYTDGEALPPALLLATLNEIVRVVSVPVSVDLESGYGSDPEGVAQMAKTVVEAGAVGVNLEDGSAPPEALCARIEAAKRGAAHAGVDLFVNARTDVYLRPLVPPERALEETIARAARYADAGADGIFVPGLTAPAEIAAIVASTSLPLNLLLRAPGPPPVAELQKLGVRRLSAGSSLTQAVLGALRRATTQLLETGRYDGLFEGAFTYADMNALFPKSKDRDAAR
jgi:2-methylisocitrate lyase-like PEP mutase family enzyme